MFFLFYSILFRPGLFFVISTLIFLAVLFIEHWIQDFLKGKSELHNRQTYYIDQVLHIAVLYFYRIFIYPG